MNVMDRKTLHKVHVEGIPINLSRDCMEYEDTVYNMGCIVTVVDEAAMMAKEKKPWEILCRWSSPLVVVALQTQAYFARFHLWDSVHLPLQYVFLSRLLYFAESLRHIVFVSTIGWQESGCGLRRSTCWGLVTTRDVSAEEVRGRLSFFSGFSGFPSSRRSCLPESFKLCRWAVTQSASLVVCFGSDLRESYNMKRAVYDLIHGATAH
jgi:hypothetical protein